MQKWIALAITSCCLALTCCCDTESVDAPKAHTASGDAVGSTTPWLRGQYGELCEIRATLLPIDSRSKRPSKDLLQILEIEGVDYTGDALIHLSFWDADARDQVDALEPGEAFRATGYESVATVGIPDGLVTYDNGRYRDRIYQGSSFSAQHTFVVLSIP